MNVEQIRETFIRFYTERGHMLIPSASLIPFGDPTLLFTSAGMVPFKPYFTGLAEPPSPRMCTVQKCFRTTDIDEVGDYSHLTMFEMLGNFSVGDYFKREAIEWAWQLLTDGFKLPKADLWVSIFLTDDEAHDLWIEQGVPEARIHRYPEENNYWFSGDVGPCGPNSEIFVDRGPRETCDSCRAGACKPNLEPDCGRFLEVWNLVFMTLYQAEDGTRTELPRKNIDTGSGLERMAVVLQGKDTVYDTDIFRPILAAVGAQVGKEYERANDDESAAMRIIAEHTRAATFLIADGVLPSNDGRGYVLRRIMRRAMYFLVQIGDPRLGPILPRIADAVVLQMGSQYRELVDRHEFIRRLMEAEENRFKDAIQRGRHVLDAIVIFKLRNKQAIHSALKFANKTKSSRAQIVQTLRTYMTPSSAEEPAFDALVRYLGDRVGEWSDAVGNERALIWSESITGPEAFLLSDTYGYPLELTQEIAAEKGFSVDLTGFEREMQAQRERGRAAAKFDIDADRTEAYAQLAHIRTQFVGYDRTHTETTVAGIIGAGGVQESAEHGEDVEIVLVETPFYPEGGGQAGDSGLIVAPGRPGDPGVRVAIDDTQNASEGLIVHRGRVVEGRIAVNDAVTASVDPERRRASQRNHTATHLLHAALRQVLGDHVRQAGSLVAPDRLRFDFTHIEATKPEEVAAAQRLVNEKIREDIDVHWEHMPYDDAVASGAMALFGEKYHANVRVVGICEPETTANNKQQTAETPHMHCFSKELCGGTHVHRTGEIGAFVIASESSVGSGLRRIEALTGALADAFILEQQSTVARLSRRLNAPPAEIEARIDALQAELDAERKRAQQFERAAGRSEVDALVQSAEQVGGTSVIVARVQAANVDAMREMTDVLREKLASAVVILGAVTDDRPTFLAMATKDLAGKVHAGNIVKQVAAVTGGSGGGRPDMAQAGGKDASKLDEALALARRLATDALSAT